MNDLERSAPSKNKYGGLSRKIEDVIHDSFPKHIGKYWSPILQNKTNFPFLVFSQNDKDVGQFVHDFLKVQSSFSHPHVILNLCGFLSSAEHIRSYFEDSAVHLQ